MRDKFFAWFIYIYCMILILSDFVCLFTLTYHFIIIPIMAIFLGLFIWIRKKQEGDLWFHIFGTISFFGFILSQDNATSELPMIFIHICACSYSMIAYSYIKERNEETTLLSSKRFDVPSMVNQIENTNYIKSSAQTSVSFINERIRNQLKNGPYVFTIYPYISKSNTWPPIIYGVDTYYIAEDYGQISFLHEKEIFKMGNSGHKFRSFDFADSEVFLTALYMNIKNLINTNEINRRVESIILNKPDYSHSYGNIIITCYKKTLSDKDPFDFFKNNS